MSHLNLILALKVHNGLTGSGFAFDRDAQW